MENWIVGIFLGICSVTDIKRKEIPLAVVAVFGVLGLFFQMLGGTVEVWEWLFGCLLGIGILGIGFVTRGAIGYGDGLAISVVGIWLGFFAAFEILFLSLCVSAFVSAILLVVKKMKRGYQIPLLPFIWLSWIIWILSFIKSAKEIGGG